MDYSLIPLSSEHQTSVMAIFNHYVRTSLAAFPDHELPEAAFAMFLKMTEGYPAYVVADETGTVRGFGMVRAYHPMPTFARTAEISYFLHPDATGAGLGTMLLTRLLEDARGKRIATILACITADNEGSIRFHARHGFAECGRFRQVFVKQGAARDIVWMQRML